MGKREELYTKAFSAYQKQRYEDAALSFQMLLYQSPFEEKYWRGFAASCQMAKRYESALSAWALTTLLSPQDPSPHLHAAECYFYTDQKEEGLKALNIAEEMVLSSPTVEGVSEKIAKLRGLYANNTDHL